MSELKNNPDIKIFYTDTDSLFTNKELDPKFLDNKEIGKFKLEYFIKRNCISLQHPTYCPENTH